ATRSKNESALSGSPRNNARRPLKKSLWDSKVAHAAMSRSAAAKRKHFISRSHRISAGRVEHKLIIGLFMRSWFFFQGWGQWAPRDIVPAAF
ncbi:hypothetical protein, partial [Methyloceanibacter sp.]|uniref:hypothetical protein n=1 Tax=Methyloceanibacter sp. TaxID=1965321 RepID=UPI003D6CBE3B